MKKFLYPLFAVLTSLALVLGGFSFSAQQGRYCAFEVQRAEAAVPLTAPYIFGALLGCFGVSIAGQAAFNGQDVETALNEAWSSFQSFAPSDTVSQLVSAFANVTSPVTPLSVLGLSQAIMHTIADWILHGSTVEVDSVQPSVTYRGYQFAVVSPDSPLLRHNHSYSGQVDIAYLATSNSVTTEYISRISGTPTFFNFRYSGSSYFDLSGASFYSNYWEGSSFSFRSDISSKIYPLAPIVYLSSAISTPIKFGFNGNDGSFNPSTLEWTSSSSTYPVEYTAPSSGIASSSSVTSVPSSISSAISSGDSSAYADAVSDATQGLNLNVDSATVDNPAWSDVFGEIPATLDSILEAVQSGFAGVLEGVQTFFRPVVEFFAPLDIRDSDDIGDLVISNVSKEHTFTTKFPFCLVNDYKSLYEKAISPAGGSSDYLTPGHFVVKLPAMNGLNSQPITLDMTYIFTNKYMGLTLGQISQLFVAIACLAMFLHWVGDMINVVKSPNYGYVTVEGEAVGRGR